jgi:hsp33 protein
MGSRDYLLRATAAEGQIRAFVCTTRDTAEEQRKLHNTSPIATAAMGRLMSAALMMGVDLKGDKDLITLSIKGDGPMKSLVATADSHGTVKAACANPYVILPAKADGHLDVGGAVGKGFLSVIRDNGLGEPYVGQTQLLSGEIAEDVNAYFSISEQIPSSVGLGVLLNKENTVEASGGFIIQLLPFAEESLLDKLEEKLKTVHSVTDLLKDGHTPESLLEFLLGDFSPEIHEKRELSYFCNCSRERVEKALISLGKKEIESLISDHKAQEVRCDFCNKRYVFTEKELEELLKR